MPIKKDKKTKSIVVKKKSTKGKTSQSQSITVNIHKGKSAPKQPSGKPTIASSIASLANVIRSSDFYKPVAPQAAPSLAQPIKVVSNVPIESLRTPTAKQSQGIASITLPAPYKLEHGYINLPTREPVNLKLPPKRTSSPLKHLVQNVERNRMAEEEHISRAFLPQGPALKPYYQGTSSETVTIKRPIKKPTEEFGVGISDVMSDISTTPLYEGGKEVAEPTIKRSYTKSGKYSKKQPKQPSLIPVVSGETEESFYPTKLFAQVPLSYALGKEEQIY